jgi:hypothetical protein
MRKLIVFTLAFFAATEITAQPTSDENGKEPLSKVGLGQINYGDTATVTLAIRSKAGKGIGVITSGCSCIQTEYFPPDSASGANTVNVSYVATRAGPFYHTITIIFLGAVEIKKILLFGEVLESTENTVLEKTEIEARVNVAAWRRHLEGNLLEPLERAARDGMRAGNYTVVVRFLVERDGSISYAKALKDPGYGLARAAEDIVKTGPRWQPGEQNGKTVRSYHTQPITFQVQKQ